MKREPPSFSAVAANTAFLVAAIAVAAAAWWPIYESTQFIVLVAVATAAGAAIAILGYLMRLSSAIVVPLAVVAFAIIGVPLAVPERALYGVLPSVDGLRELFAAVVLGWKQLLTITLPVGSYQALLVPVLSLVLLGSVVGLSLALWSRRGDLAVLAPLALFLTGLAFGPDNPRSPIQLSLSLLGVLLTWLLWRRSWRRRAMVRSHQYSRAGRRVRAIVSAALMMGIAGGTAVALTAALPPQVEREVLRSHVAQPFDPRQYPSPLAGFRQYFRDESADSVIFTVSGLAEGQRLRIATLDSYDGIVYSVGSAAVSSESGFFTRVPLRVDQTAISGARAELDIEVGDYSEVWLPTTGQLESIRFDGETAPDRRTAFYYNDVSGTAAVVGGVASGDSFTLHAVLPPQPGENEVAGLSPGSATVPPIAVVPAELSTMLERYTEGIDSAGARLAAMLDGLRSDGYVSHGIGEGAPPSRSGHSADRITELASSQRMIGDAEQYAVAAAIMARELGFPARVVFGFDPGEKQRDSETALEVTGSMVSAWIEVSTSEYGWVAIDPNPPVREIPEEQPEEPSAVSRPESIIQPPEQENEPTTNQTQIESTQEEPDSVEGWLLVLLAIGRALGWTLLVVGLAISPFLLIVGAKLRRRALRRGASTPLQRITGGWKEFEDAVLDHGFEPAQYSTRAEIAAQVGGKGSMEVATIADRATFAPAMPSADEAAKLWRSVDELALGLRSGKTRWERIKANISLRSLGGYSVRSLFKRQGSTG